MKISEHEDYRSIDEFLVQWEKDTNLRFEREHRGCAVRSIWIDRKVQFWVDAPDQEGFVLIHAAELDESLPSKWGRRVELRATPAELHNGLDEVWLICQRWIEGPKS